MAPKPMPTRCRAPPKATRSGLREISLLVAAIPARDRGDGGRAPMRIDHGLAGHALVARHGQQLRSMLQVSDMRDVHGRIDLAASHEPESFGDIPGAATR